MRIIFLACLQCQKFKVKFTNKVVRSYLTLSKLANDAVFMLEKQWKHRYAVLHKDNSFITTVSARCLVWGGGRGDESPPSGDFNSNLSFLILYACFEGWNSSFVSCFSFYYEKKNSVILLLVEKDSVTPPEKDSVLHDPPPSPLPAKETTHFFKQYRTAVREVGWGGDRNIIVQ